MTKQEIFVQILFYGYLKEFSSLFKRWMAINTLFNNAATNMNLLIQTIHQCNQKK
ncbi:hypothetical protein TTHERM_00252320 (macronuclear) [Tetrahymena thermophila SB210]|uniref:Uncharacterized protein n=1 Tax=Tetrahymena thermophila (strain SB210) TaxID=312017 RepID=Q23QQ0_TETTS|nr:hypothetical protein TTHERM_00252320 [Tetrahymena thermophila SB210]EAR98838.1 hypothetical protein TTHERM_00252320 [Tetrahymena thermophila SB210]|eukprot:XP_001019083.1 hypothetical protein TTHERM_00252320 [Tetrahymena thermophila SB210]